MITSRVSTFLRLPMSRRSQAIRIVLARLLTHWVLRRRMLGCGPGSIIMKPLFWTPEYIELGARVLIMANSRIEAITDYGGVKFTPSLVVGDETSFQQNVHITCASKLIIGKGVTVSSYSMITDNDHEYERLDMNVLNQPIRVRATVIEDFCFIGSGAKILAGTRLGRQCIVGANAVVRGAFPPYSVIVGNPGRIVKKYDSTSGSWVRVDSMGSKE